jgi:hypothetical protein
MGYCGTGRIKTTGYKLNFRKGGFDYAEAIAAID